MDGVGIDEFPTELLVHMFVHPSLSVRDLANLSVVCWSFHVAANDNHVWRTKCSRLRKYCFIRLKLGLKESEGKKEEEEKEATSKAISWKEVFKQAVKGDADASSGKATANFKELWDSTPEQRKSYFEKTYGSFLEDEEEALAIRHSLTENYPSNNDGVEEKDNNNINNKTTENNSNFITPSVASVMASLQRGGATFRDWGPDWYEAGRRGFAPNVIVDDLHDMGGDEDGDDDYELQLALALSMKE